jgi:hypothetical protein
MQKVMFVANVALGHERSVDLQVALLCLVAVRDAAELPGQQWWQALARFVTSA